MTQITERAVVPDTEYGPDGISHPALNQAREEGRAKGYEQGPQGGPQPATAAGRPTIGRRWIGRRPPSPN